MGHLPLFLKEVLPIAADIATVVSFVSFLGMKLLATPLLSEWLTRLKIFVTVYRGFFIVHHLSPRTAWSLAWHVRHNDKRLSSS